MVRVNTTVYKESVKSLDGNEMRINLRSQERVDVFSFIKRTKSDCKGFVFELHRNDCKDCKPNKS